MNFSNQPTASTSLKPCFSIEDFNIFMYLLLIIYSLFFIFGLLLNTLVLFVITFCTKHWTPFTIYMLNLTVCDTLFILMLPFSIYNAASSWSFGETLCKIVMFLIDTNLYGSILFLSVISLHRFISICYPVRSLSWNSTRRAKQVSVGVWACVLSCQAPVLYFSGTMKYGNSPSCTILTGQELFNDFLVYNSVISVVMFALPFMVVMVCYILMLRKLLEPSWGSGEGEQGLRAAHRTKQKSVKMIIIVLVTFMLCFLPYHIFSSLFLSFMYLSLNHQEQVTCEWLVASIIASEMTGLMVTANSIMNPILYFMAGQDFRKKIMKKKQNKAENGLPECANTALMTSL